ncbi:predicted protein [Chaetomium globosum CBS 148.51]|uniref:Uncharacterized protein n=1 Tax=Chaetomium globosum (strain ATCC 6205 / CBS 148.51 / DSM 1962 / NBRC 6347 / NRRL 1970) TaxID=306901 RepID=Q2H0T2_CHAGB|nr:uncharacterized protein CHGG_04614 [Chaetomium globosum CBS 148.51]EAQ87995.1 predicted protein [Chaetomium globosum CBS 148.51]
MPAHHEALKSTLENQGPQVPSQGWWCQVGVHCARPRYSREAQG